MVYTEELFYQAVKLVENVRAQITSNTCVHVGFTASKMKCLDAMFCCETDLSEWQESLYWFSSFMCVTPFLCRLYQVPAISGTGGCKQSPLDCYILIVF